LFRDHHLGITIEVGLTRVNFLDVVLDLEKEIFKPYRKPGDKPVYVNACSNHPPRVLKNIPLGINRRLCDISCNEEVFQEAIPVYQEELKNCGYTDKLVWMGDIEKKQKRTRSRKVVWFNPPYSQNVQTNVGKEFLKLIDKHFPNADPLHKILNRNTIKISYRCLPNMGRKIATHNSKILKKCLDPAPPPKAGCNCQKSKKADCQLPGECNTNGVVYEAVVTTSDGQRESYVGLAKNFKRRWPKHKATLGSPTADGQTTLSRYVWRQRDQGLNPEIEWKILEKNVADFNPITGLCRLCTREKYQIVLNPSVASLNSRTEVFAQCRHRALYLMGEPPD
jgi:hypothetical protein